MKSKCFTKNNRLVCVFLFYFFRFMDVVDLLFKEIVLSRPEINVLLELSYFLKATSHNAAFVTKLCTMQSQNTLKFNVKEGYFTYNQSIFNKNSVIYRMSLKCVYSVLPHDLTQRSN